MLEHDIRYTRPDDLCFLEKWLMDSDNLKWFPVSSIEEIKEMAKNWVSYYKINSSLTATIGSVPCAIGTLFLMPYRKTMHHCMFYLIVDSAFKKQGIGTSMVKNLLNLASNYFCLESVYAEIYEGCPILSILQKLDFEVFAIQEKFVKSQGGYKERILLEHFFKR